MKASKGFTLIELMIVVAIIGIIAAIAVPTLISTRTAAVKSFAHGECSTVRSAQAAYYAQNGVYGSAAQLVADDFLDPSFDPWVPANKKNVTMAWVNTDTTFSVTFTIPNPPTGETGVFVITDNNLITYDGLPA